MEGADPQVTGQVRGALVYGCRADGDVGTFLRLEGERTSRIALVGNDFRGVERPVDEADDVPDDALRVIGGP